MYAECNDLSEVPAFTSDFPQIFFAHFLENRFLNSHYTGVAQVLTPSSLETGGHFGFAFADWK